MWEMHGDIVAECNGAVAKRDNAVAKRNGAVAKRDNAVARRNEAVAKRTLLRAIHPLRRRGNAPGN